MPAYHFIEDILKPYLRETTSDKRMSTLKLEAACSNRLGEFFSGQYISIAPAPNVITGSLVRSYRETRKRQGVSPITAQRELSVASRAVNYAITEWDYDISNPFEKRTISSRDAKALRANYVKRILTPEEELKILAVSCPLLRDIIVFAVNTGLRMGEICNLRWDQVRGDEIHFKPEEQKNGKRGVRGINAKARSVVARQPEICEYVFTRNGIQIYRSLLHNLFCKAKKVAGLDDVKFKDLRKTCGSRMVAIGRMEDAKTQLGHSDIRTTQMCYAVDSIDAAKAVLEEI